MVAYKTGALKSFFSVFPRSKTLIKLQNKINLILDWRHLKVFLLGLDLRFIFTTVKSYRSLKRVVTKHCKNATKLIIKQIINLRQTSRNETWTRSLDIGMKFRRKSRVIWKSKGRNAPVSKIIIHYDPITNLHLTV